MMRLFTLAIAGRVRRSIATQPPNSADVRYDGRDRALQVMVSSLQPPPAVALVANDGAHYPQQASRS